MSLVILFSLAHHLILLSSRRPEKLPVDKGLKIARSDYNKLLAVKLDILLKG